ncbi:MAG: glycine--tRNA ligase subunit beta [Burkholderiales bacterium]|nr:glycine--tRNA ligase subunit beta [Burkholderiales bacterium]
MTTATLLVELLTEELPPKALRKLGAAFAEGLAAGLRERGFLTDDSTITPYATPRRLAVTISAVRKQSLPKAIERKLMPVKVGLDPEGKPTPALTKKLASFGLAELAVEQMERRLDRKTETLFYRDLAAGAPLRASLEGALQDAIEELPIPKVMSYQDADGNPTQFVRPAHKLVALLGSEVEPVTALGLIAYRTTLGHRFLSTGDIPIRDAGCYAETLRTEGRVISSFDERRAMIKAALTTAANGERIIQSDALLDEVTALVEWPAIYRGEFDATFLRVPQECLILSMQQHQKYFPLADADGTLQNRFLIVSNLPTDEPGEIVRGNERVLRARLSDAKFFFDQDRKTRLDARVSRLANVVYNRKLGSQLDRVERLEKLAVLIAGRINADPLLAGRSAQLSKADLLTDMVGEFPELQGVMGRYYALADGEPAQVADAIECHYRPKFSGDALPPDRVSISVALADKLEALAGLFGIGQQPGGDKDPFALRRHALGIVRILVEGKLEVALDEIVAAAFSVFPNGMLTDARVDLESFIFERLRGYLRETGYSANEIEAVLCMRPMQLGRVPRQLAAVRAFSALPEAESLAVANKRVVNILKQADARGVSFLNAEAGMLQDAAELALFHALQSAARQAAPLFRSGDFTGYLKTFAVLKSPVDAFFDSVMVMVDDPALRQNRLGLLADLRREMNQVADISKLAA